MTFREAAEALESIVPCLVNDSFGTGTGRAVVAIVDRFESCASESSSLESMPDAGGPIMPLEGQNSTAAVLDSWLAKGTLLSSDGTYSVFVVFMDVMRRPYQGSWTATTMTVLGTKQSLTAYLNELAEETVAA